MKTETFTVHKMGCANCPVRIQKALADLDGVTAAEASLEGQSATVTYDEGQTSREELKETVDDLGYELILPED